MHNTLWRDSNFRWLMGGAVLSGLGDQFTMIALPWLVLKMTGSSLALGLVIATMSVPRAIFMLIGGALVDRYSPKSVLMVTKFANALVIGTLAALVLAMPAMLTLPLLYALALALGLAQAFASPAGTSILPTVVARERLQAANSTMMGVRQSLMLMGPLLGALLMVLGGDDIHAAANGGGNANGIGYAFGFDCASFLISAWTLAKVHALAAANPAPVQNQGVLHAVVEGMRTLWQNVAVRTCFIYWSLVAVAVGGTMQVALPLLASRNLDGAASLGILMSAHGIGTLAGMAMSRTKMRTIPFGATILAIDALVGLLMAPLGTITAAWQGMALLGAIGVLGGYMQVAIFTWIQQSVPPHMLGRAMSIFMCIFMGVAPLSGTVIGALLQWISLAQLFAGCGALLLALATFAWMATPMRHIESASAPRAVSQP
ncbi:MFS transporter [Pseudoduganella ginsengisoli]|uniref:MFS transporter n=1 Tax=Pseudoduganella ginsengisoli TaxID=1462440 RepID=A0A6L6Q0T1_9BURK|nr:MFS transporter [Pseudoduganella ginsengisoli]MTW03437.1 MFS transporter [Pseudoduganella ginsengisoli]